MTISGAIFIGFLMWSTGSICLILWTTEEYKKGYFFNKRIDSWGLWKEYKFGLLELAQTVEKDDLKTIAEHISWHIYPFFWPFYLIYHSLYYVTRFAQLTIGSSFSGSKALATAIVKRTTNEVVLLRKKAITKQEKEGSLSEAIYYKESGQLSEVK